MPSLTLGANEPAIEKREEGAKEENWRIRELPARERAPMAEVAAAIGAALSVVKSAVASKLGAGTPDLFDK